MSLFIQVHIFDPSTPCRRPVLEAEFGEYPLTTLSLPSSGNTVVVGNTHGQIALLDLRKGLVRGCLKGLSGGVRGLQCHSSQPVVASCGLDRFLRIHNLEDRKVQHKVYLKSRLNCLLLSSQDLEIKGAEEEGSKNQEVKKEDEDEVWDTMEKVEEAGDKLKRKVVEIDVEEEVEDKDEEAPQPQQKKSEKKMNKKNKTK